MTYGIVGLLEILGIIDLFILLIQFSRSHLIYQTSKINIFGIDHDRSNDHDYIQMCEFGDPIED